MKKLIFSSCKEALAYMADYIGHKIVVADSDWIQELETDDKNPILRGVFSEGSNAQRMVEELKKAFPVGKKDSYQKAMGKLTIIRNFKDKTLSDAIKLEIERAKDMLRTVYKRDDRREEVSGYEPHHDERKKVIEKRKKKLEQKEKAEKKKEEKKKNSENKSS